MPKGKLVRHDIALNKNSITDDGAGVITFNGGLTLSDESEQMNGTRYDLSSMDLSRFRGNVFADHDYSVQAIVGKAFGVAVQGSRLVAEGVRFAVKESGLARFVYEMVKGGFVDAVSIGSFGPEADENGVYHNAVLKEFSFVGIGNNENAVINKLAVNSLKESESEGADTTTLKQFLTQHHIEVTEEPVKKINKKVSMKKKLVKQEAPKAPEQPDLSAVVSNAVAEAVKPLAEQVATLEKQAFNKAAAEPEFTPTAKSGLEGESWRDLTASQVQNFLKAEKYNDSAARKTLNKINAHNLEQLKEKGMVANTITITDMGNFVTNPELLSEIQGYRSDYSAILSAFPYRDTNSLKLGWLVRSGDIDMEPVEMCDDGADGNLKPISEYAATAKEKSLEEMAAVTPVCSAATIFLAADLIDDATMGYRNSYDRNLARGIIAALELAAEDNDEASIAYSGDLDDAAGAATGLGELRQAIFAISQGEGVLVMNEATYGIIWNALVLLGAGGQLTDTIIGGERNLTLWSKRVVVVPNDLMPTLGDTATYKSYSYEGSTVTVNHAIFYVNPSNVRARQNGGLRFDLSTEAAYEVNGVVKSAYQRNEIVLRGSHFRGTAILDPSRVGAVRAGSVIS